MVVVAAVVVLASSRTGNDGARPSEQRAEARSGRAARPARTEAAGRRPPGKRPDTQAAIARFVSLGLPLYCGGRRRPDVALTFDDGPGPYTSLALRILEHAGAHATFFLVGRNLARFPAYLPRAERRLGAVGDHTWNHVDLRRLDRRLMAEEIVRTQVAVARAAGGQVELFRPPCGAHDAAVDAEVHARGLLEVLWSIDTRDSEGAPWRQIAATAERRARPGSIILLHENRGQTIRALRFLLLPWFHRHRFTLVSIPELLALDPPTLVQLRAGGDGC